MVQPRGLINGTARSKDVAASYLVKSESSSSFLIILRACTPQQPESMRGAIVERVWTKIEDVDCPLVSIRLSFVLLFTLWPG